MQRMRMECDEMTDPAPEGIIMWHAAIEAAADRASRRSHLRQEHAAKIFQMDYPQAVIDSKTVSAKADEAASISDEIRSLPTPGDLRAALARAPEVQTLVEAAVLRALEAAAWKSTSFLVGDLPNLRNPMAHEVAAAIRAIAADPDAVKRIAEGRKV